MGLLVVGGLLVENTEDWRKAIFALMLFSVVVGLPEGLMGFAARFLTRLFRVAPAPLPPPSPSDLDSVTAEVASADGSALLELDGPEAPLRRRQGGGRPLHDRPIRADPRRSSARTGRARARS